MNKTKVLLGIVGIVFLVWSVGILTRFWANPIFSVFWVASNSLADNLSYFGLGIGAFALVLALIVYGRKTINGTTNPARPIPTKQLKLKLTVLLGLAGIVFLVWGIGIITRLWANPIFSSFMFVSNNAADILSYFGLGFGAVLLVWALMVYHSKTKTVTVKSGRSYPHKLLKVKSYDDYLQRKSNARIETNNDSNQFVIVNGRQLDLGSEVMEKIVDQ